MREGLLLLAISLAGGAALAVGLRRARQHRLVLSRLESLGPEPDVAPGLPWRDRPFVRRYYFLPWLVGLALSTILLVVFLWPTPYAVAPGVLLGLIGTEIDRFRVSRMRALIEVQLAGAIDLMVGSLQAGAGAMAALESAARESQYPLKPQLEELVGRIRLGDDPQSALAGLARRVPLENMSLFTSAMSVHWEVGGSLAGTLATVGKSIRDRIDISRRVQSLTAQTRFSIAVVLLGTYMLALLIWRSNPGQMEGFVKSTVGSYLIAAAMLLQALGILWAASMSRFRY